MTNIILPTCKTTADQKQMLLRALMRLRAQMYADGCRISAYVYDVDSKDDSTVTLVNVHFHNELAVKQQGEIGEKVYDILLWHFNECQTA